MDMLPRAFSLVGSGRVAAYLAVCVLAGACGSSSTTITSPGSLSKCGVTLGAPASTLPASGGTGSIAVKTERECEWTAATEAAWLTLSGARTGQGDGTIQFAASANGDPLQRTGVIITNDKRVEVTQAAGECRFELGSSSASLPNSGGSQTVQVRASSAMCAWTAVSHADWIDLRSGREGRGDGSVAFDVEPTAGPPRTGALTIAGQRYNVTQSEGCTFAIAPTSYAAAASGGESTVAVTAAPGCPWTAASNVDWIAIDQGAAATGDGTVRFTVSSTAGPTRTGTLNVAGQVVTVTQGQGCTYAIAPESQSAPPSGSSGTVNVTAGAGCSWNASSNAQWITITSGTSGSGPGSVGYTVAATSGPSRSGTLTIAGRTFTVNQGQGCTYTITPESQTVPGSGGGGTVNVAAADGCGWRASSNAPWITITSPPSGNGAGSVAYSVAPSTASSRSGTLTIAGRTFTVNQGQGCTFTISPTSHDFGNPGGTVDIVVSTDATCAWAASEDIDWLSLSTGGGTGSATLQLTAGANSGGTSRTGTATVAGRTFTVTQSGCSAALSPAEMTVPAAGGDGSFMVDSGDGCQWNAETASEWISFHSRSGTGDGVVQFRAGPNTGPPRAGTISVLGQTLTVRQEAGCSYQVSPESAPVSASGGSVTVNVTAGTECAWTASSNADWITVVSGTPGTGNGPVQLGVQPTTGPARTGTATVAGRPVTINQESGCTITIDPPSTDVKKDGGVGAVSVTASDGGCTWTATSTVPWIQVTGGESGSGSGVVQYAVAPNPDPNTRQGSLTIAGQSFAVKQDGAQ